MALKSLISTFLFLTMANIYSAACCGGGASLPTLITGDYQGQVVLSGSNSAFTHDTNQLSEIKKRSGNNQEVVEVLSLSGAFLISPYWQIGATIPLKMNTHRTPKMEESTTGIGDPKFQIAFEFLPEYGFSYWKPRGLIFLEQSFSTANSTYDARKPLRSDSLGNGFSTTAIGVSLFKVVKNSDFIFMSEVHQGLKREFELSGSRFSVTPRTGFSTLLGAGISPFGGNLRLGTTLLYSKEGKKITRGSLSNESLPLYFWEVGFNASYLLENWSFQASYRDQTFLAKANNTPLSKSIGLSIIRFFEL